MEEFSNIKGVEFKATVVYSFEAHGEKHNVSLRPGEVDDFLENGIDDVELFLSERFLKKYHFFKNDCGRWDRVIGNSNPSFELELPHYFFREGGLTIQFGTVNQIIINLINGSINRTDDLPTKVLPIKEDKNFYQSGQFICHNSDKLYFDWYINAVEIPTFEANEEKINRWIAGEFEVIALKKYTISYLNWYLNKHPKASEKIYQWFTPKFNRIIEEEKYLKIHETKWPDGFLDWVSNYQEDGIKNIILSSKGISKFAI